MKIKIPETRLVDVKLLKRDGDNPNKMTKMQMESLKKNIKKYGFLVPLITNKNLLIADGEHKLQAGLDLGMEKVPVISLPVDEVNRKMLRQVMNKLKGEHDPDLDRLELERIRDTEELSSLLGMSENTLLSGLEERPDLAMLDDKYDENKVPVFVEQLYFTAEELEVFSKFLNSKMAKRFSEIVGEMKDSNEFHKLIEIFEAPTVKTRRIEKSLIDLIRNVRVKK